MTADPFLDIEDGINAALAEWNDPVVVWLGRAVWAGILVGGFALGGGLVFGAMHAWERMRTLGPWTPSLDCSDSSP